MALIKIKTDAFNICERIKKINKDYFVVYNTKQNKYEIHNKSQKPSTFCISCENGLNFLVIQKLRKTKIENLNKILLEINNHNEKLEQEQKRQLFDKASWKAREMFNYANTKVEDCDFSDSYSTKWA